MVYLHRRYECVAMAGSHHEHKRTDTLQVPDPDSLDLEGDGTIAVPALIPGGDGVWRVSCTAACEAEILAKIQYSGASPQSIPLMEEEKEAAKAEAVRGNVEVANLARAMHQMVHERAQVGFGASA